MPQPKAMRRRRRNVEKVRSSSLGRTLQHPVDRIDDRRGPFDQFAERASFLASSPLFFVICVVLVLVWAVGLVVGASNRFEAATAGLMSAVTLILVAVLKNSELRTERALQTKLDAIASSLLEDRRGHRGDAEDQLAVGVHVHAQAVHPFGVMCVKCEGRDNGRPGDGRIVVTQGGRLCLMGP